jgi:hypothetical protein
MVVPAIDKGNSYRGALEPASRIEPREAAAEYQDVRNGPRLPSLWLPWMHFHIHRPMVWRRHRAKRTTSSSGGTASSFA